MKSINQRLILAALFGLFAFVASSPFGIQTVAAQSAPADCTNISDFSASVSTTEELDSWIICYNQAPVGTHTINLTQNIKLTSALTPIANNQSAELVIDGNGYWLSGGNSYKHNNPETFRHFIITIGHVTFKNIDLEDGQTSDTLCDGVACAGSVFIDSGANVTFINSDLHRNEVPDANSMGGGMFIRGIATLYNSSIYDGKAGYGGGAYLDGGVLNVHNGVLQLNLAYDQGGAVYLNGGTVNIDKSLLYYNEAQWGGTIYSVGGLIHLHNSTVGESIARQEAGVIYTDTTATIINVTFNYNHAYNGGTASTIYLASETEPLYLYNSLLSNGYFETHCRPGFGNIIAVNSMADDASCGDIPETDDLRLGRRASSGGTTDSYPLYADSPAIDAGDNAICQAAPINGVDQRGFPRPAWGTCDIGAYEFEEDASEHCAAIADFTADVATAAALNSWIDCFNAAGSGSHTINLSQDITLTANTTAINNSGDATLLINGNGYVVDGAGSYRPFAIQAGDVSISNITLQNGYSAAIDCGGSSGCAGALFVGSDAIVTLSKATLQNNVSSYGAAVAIYEGQLTIEQSTLVGNSATQAASAVYTAAGTVKINNSTLSDNNDSTLYGLYAGMEVTNSTIVADSAAATRVAGAYGGRITMKNSIIVGPANTNNCKFSTGGMFGGKTRVRINNTNLSDDGSCGNAVTSSSINLGPLQDNGGATMTHTLLAGSSAIDAGDATVCQSDAVNNVDQRGVARSQGTACDVGAVEMQASELGGTAVSLAGSNLTLIGILGGLLFLGLAGVVIRQRQA
ncbi:MAG: choice-of-anchor Q domain-containing protein [Chloroflexota bacterium]